MPVEYALFENNVTADPKPPRRRVDVGANPGSELPEDVRAGAKVEKLESVKPSPNPIEYHDVGSDTTNDTVTVNNIGQPSGCRLKFDPAAADEGLYFVANAGGPTQVPTVQKNKPSQLVFLAPNLAEGTYHLEIRARMGTGTSSRELRIGRLDATMTVLPS